MDYITNDKIGKGAKLALHYPPELLLAPSPVAIFKSSGNKEISKKFVDYLLGKEAQTLIANEGTISVRPDVKSPEKFKLPAPEDALKRSIKINYLEMIASKDAVMKKFNGILKGN